MGTGVDIIRLDIPAGEWDKLKVILLDCAALSYYKNMAKIMLSQAAKQQRKSSRKKVAIIPQ